MGKELAQLVRFDRRIERKHEQSKRSPEERQALAILRREARHAGATLFTNGEGGLPPSLVLTVMRRDEYRCKKCGTQRNLIVHHKGGLQNPTSEWLEKKGKSNDTNNIVTLCEGCHNDIHVDDKNQ